MGFSVAKLKYNIGSSHSYESLSEKNPNSGKWNFTDFLKVTIFLKKIGKGSIYIGKKFKRK